MKTDFKEMTDKLDINWDTFFEDCDDDVDHAWDKFMQKYNEVDRECVPRKLVTTSNFFLLVYNFQEVDLLLK